VSSFHLSFVAAVEQAGTANQCGVCGEVTNGRVLRCQQAGFTLDSNRYDLHRNRDHPLVLDVRMPGLSGLELQRELADAGHRIPIIFITGHGDIPMTVRAMKAGAVEFLPKPFRDQDLLDAIAQSLERDEAARQQRTELADIQARYDTLTAREREVIVLIVRGMLNKQAAAELGITEITIKVHRHNIMEKMKARSLPELVRMIEKLRPIDVANKSR
jgi:FixJ family two-component response regulator